jgi:hypothetical protein
VTLLLLSGIAGTGLFVLTFLLDGATRPGYDPIRQPVSALALGPRGWLATTNFLVSGALITTSAAGVYQATRSPWLGGLIVVFGLTLIAAGVFPMDPMRGYPPGTPDSTPPTTSMRHKLHDWAGTAVFTTLAASTAVATFTLDDPAWATYSAATAIVFTVFFLSFGVAWEADNRRTGLLQRLAIIPGWTWFGLLCWHLIP